MSSEPTPDPAEPSDDDLASEREAECARMRRAIRRFVAGGDGEAGGERDELRAHLRRCGECRDQYRSEVVLVAGLARAGDRSPVSVERLRARARDIVTGSRREKRVSLVHLVLPAFGLYALFVIGGGEHPARVLSVDGAVQLGSRDALARGDERELRRGVVCTTDALSRGRIEAGGSVLTLEPGTALLVERTSPLRVRLFGGCVLVDGPAIVTSAAGVVESTGGSGCVRLDASALDVASANESWRVSAASGELLATPGEPVRLPAAIARGL